MAVAFDLNRPPARTWFEITRNGFRLSASLRSGKVWLLGFLFLIFAAPAVVPQLFTAPGSPSLADRLVAFTVLSSLLFLGAGLLVLIRGFETIEVADGIATVFFGWGKFGRTRRFLWTDVASATEEQRRFQKKHSPPERFIALRFRSNPTKIVKVGGWLTDERRQFFLGVLQSQIDVRRA